MNSKDGALIEVLIKELYTQALANGDHADMALSYLLDENKRKLPPLDYTFQAAFGEGRVTFCKVDKAIWHLLNNSVRFWRIFETLSGICSEYVPQLDPSCTMYGESKPSDASRKKAIQENRGYAYALLIDKGPLDCTRKNAIKNNLGLPYAIKIDKCFHQDTWEAAKAGGMENKYISKVLGVQIDGAVESSTKPTKEINKENDWCCWEFDATSFVYKTECGDVFERIVGAGTNNGNIHCPSCGKKITTTR